MKRPDFVPENAELRNARIIETFLGVEDHGIPTCSITLDYEDSGVQGFGNYDLRHYGIGFIINILNTVEVSQWEYLKNRYVRVWQVNSKVFCIGHITRDKWFFPEEQESTK